MGLDTSHDCWHGAYSAFMRWRQKIAEVAGFPPLLLMEGFFERADVYDPFKEYQEKCPNQAELYYASLPISWDALKPNPLHGLLHHSDCEGEIPTEQCGPIADELEKLLPLFPDDDGGGHIGMWRDKTQKFIDGLRLAASRGEAVEFH